MPTTPFIQHVALSNSAQDLEAEPEWTVEAHPRTARQRQEKLLHRPVAATTDTMVSKPLAVVPARLRPSRPRVSLCMIVKDEEANLPICLNSVVDLVDEIVVVDTGSTDRTKQVAAQLGARVHDFAWVDDFAAARNECLRRATGRWIFWLDADDRLDEQNRVRLRALFAGLKDENAFYMMKCLAPDADTGKSHLVGHSRLFPNHPAARWQYRVHEQIRPVLEKLGMVERWSDVLIYHVGYQDPVLHRRKKERNLRLLERDYADHPDDPVLLFSLGRTYVALGRTAEALPLLTRSLQRSPPWLCTLRKVYALLARAHRMLGQWSEALTACRSGRERFPKDAELLFLQGQFLAEQGDLAGAESCLLDLLHNGSVDHLVGIETGLCGYKARHELALVYELQGRDAEAEAQWKVALAEEPSFQMGWLGLGELYVRQSRWEEAEQVMRRLEANPKGAPEAAALRAIQHLARQEYTAARRILEEAIARAPEALAPRLLLNHLPAPVDYFSCGSAASGTLLVCPAGVG